MRCRAAITVVDGRRRYRSIGEEDRKSRYGVHKTWLCQWKCSWIVSSRISLSGMGKTKTGEKISAETGLGGAERPLSKVVALG